MKITQVNEDKIAKAIEDFENHVDFEFIPVIADKSSYVDHIKWILSLLFLLMFVGGVDYIFYDSWHSRTPYYIAAPFIAILLGAGLDKLDWVDRFLIPKSERARQVYEKAQRIFFLKNLHDVKSTNSLLLFISIMERRIVLLPDPRTNVKNIAEIDQKVLEVLQNSFKQKRYEEGLLQAIEVLKNELIQTHPRKTVGDNLIANKLIWWQD